MEIIDFEILNSGMVARSGRNYVTTNYKVGKRIYTNLGGPITPRTYNDYIYYITFIDKKLRYLSIKLIRLKIEVLDLFKTYKNLSKN